MAQNKVEILIPFNEGQKKGDIVHMEVNSSRIYEEHGVVRIIKGGKTTVKKEPIKKEKPPVIEKITQPESEGDALSNIINRFKQYQPCFMEVFAGDDQKKDKPRTKVFDANTASILEIQEEAEIFNIGSYGVFININPLKNSKRNKENVSKIIHIFIDLDDNATEDHNDLIKENLKKWGITYSYNAKSGHGFHFLIPIDLENNQEQTVKKFLTYLKHNICDKVDVSTFTNERLMRVPKSIHNKDKLGKNLITLHTHNPNEDEIRNNTELIHKYQAENKKGIKDAQYMASIVKKDIFFSKILTDMEFRFKVYQMLDNHDNNNNGEGTNQIFNKNLSIFAAQEPSFYDSCAKFICDWNNKYVTLKRFEHYYTKIKSGTLATDGGVNTNPKVNYLELYKWSKDNGLDLFLPLLEEQTKSSFFDNFEIYYLEDEKKEISYMLYYPNKNYFVQKSLNEVLQNIYYDAKESGFDLAKELSLDNIEDWEEMTFKKKHQATLNAIHQRLDTENRIKLIFNINYEPSEIKFIKTDGKVFFNTFVPTENWGYLMKSDRYNFSHIKELIMNLVGNNKNNYNYFIRWLGWIIQNPTEKLPTAIIFQGKQGSGKGTFKTHVLDMIFGSNCQEINQTHLESSFNEYLLGKQIIVANEVMHNDNRQTLPNVLKNLVTDPIITINRKFRKEIVGKNYTHWIFCTNSDNPIRIDEDDRRYSVFFSEKLKGGGDAAVRFIQQLRGNIDHEIKEFISYLKTIEIKYEDVHEPIMTEAKQQVIDLNRDSLDRFIEYIQQFPNLKSVICTFPKREFEYYEEDINDIRYIPTDIFFLAYEEFCKKFSERGKYGKPTFSKKIAQQGIVNQNLYVPSKKVSMRLYDLQIIEKWMIKT